jgi:hypothetical protein
MIVRRTRIRPGSPATMEPITAAEVAPSDRSSSTTDSARSTGTAPSRPPEVWASQRRSCSYSVMSASYETELDRKRRLAWVPPGAIPRRTYSCAATSMGTQSFAITAVTPLAATRLRRGVNEQALHPGSGMKVMGKPGAFQPESLLLVKQRGPTGRRTGKSM